MEDILVPIFICVVLPVAIVFIVFYASVNSDNKRAEIIIKAIEANNGVDADKLAESLKNGSKTKTEREILNLRLLRGCIFSLIGLCVIILDLLNLAPCLEFQSNIFVLLGAISFAIGVSYLVVYYVTRKQKSDSSEDK